MSVTLHYRSACYVPGHSKTFVLPWCMSNIGQNTAWHIPGARSTHTRFSHVWVILFQHIVWHRLVALGRIVSFPRVHIAYMCQVCTINCQVCIRHLYQSGFSIERWPTWNTLNTYYMLTSFHISVNNYGLEYWLPGICLVLHATSFSFHKCEQRCARITPLIY